MSPRSALPSRYRREDRQTWSRFLELELLREEELLQDIGDRVLRIPIWRLHDPDGLAHHDLVVQPVTSPDDPVRLLDGHRRLPGPLQNPVEIPDVVGGRAKHHMVVVAHHVPWQEAPGEAPPHGPRCAAGSPRVGCARSATPLPLSLAQRAEIVLAVVALIVAMVGIYGVVSYQVSQRIPEMAVRISIGAGPGEVVGLLVRSGAPGERDSRSAWRRSAAWRRASSRARAPLIPRSSSASCWSWPWCASARR